MSQIFITPSNSMTGDVGPTLGPYEHIVITNLLLRAAALGTDDALTLGHFNFQEGTWFVLGTNQLWTDLTIHEKEN